MLRIIASEQSEQEALKLDLDALVREGARRMLLAALTAEVDQYIADHAECRDAAGHALVVRNGVAEPRTVTTATGALEIQAPLVVKHAVSRAPSCQPGHDAHPSHRSTAGTLPARHLHQGLRASSGRVLRQRGWPERVNDPTADA